MGRRKTIRSPETGAIRKNASDIETEEVLKDTVLMKMLESADRQCKEGKAIPLSKLMKDLGFEEDEL